MLVFPRGLNLLSFMLHLPMLFSFCELRLNCGFIKTSCFSPSEIYIPPLRGEGYVDLCKYLPPPSALAKHLSYVGFSPSVGCYASSHTLLTTISKMSLKSFLLNRRYQHSCSVMRNCPSFLTVLFRHFFNCLYNLFSFVQAFSFFF